LRPLELRQRTTGSRRERKPRAAGVTAPPPPEVRELQPDASRPGPFGIPLPRRCRRFSFHAIASKREYSCQSTIPRISRKALSGVETPAERRAWIAELFELRRLLATIANNVNQLAKTANITGEVPVGARLTRTLGEVDELLVALREWTGARR